MERVEKYRQFIRQMLTSHATFEGGNSEVECQLVFDTEHDHYQLLDIGRDSSGSISVMHLHIKDGKIWIQRNMTDVDIALELVEIGVPEEDIVLGLHPPYKRPYTGYGVA